MITVEQLNKSGINQYIGMFERTQLPKKGVLTKKEADEYIKNNGRIIYHTKLTDNSSIVFFSDNYTMLVNMETGFVPCDCRIPMKVVPREELETGLITNVDELLLIFRKSFLINLRVIETIEELVDYLNSN